MIKNLYKAYQEEIKLKISDMSKEQICTALHNEMNNPKLAPSSMSYNLLVIYIKKKYSMTVEELIEENPEYFI